MLGDARRATERTDAQRLRRAAGHRALGAVHLVHLQPEQDGRGGQAPHAHHPHPIGGTHSDHQPEKDADGAEAGLREQTVYLMVMEELWRTLPTR